MENMIFLVSMIPVSTVFTGIGIYALRRKKPMWFWSGTTVSEEEITNVPAYNRANGIMWLSFSALLWACTLAFVFDRRRAGLLLFIGGFLGVVSLPLVYGMIYRHFRKK